MKIAMPVEDDNGMDSKICQHFGQTPFWAIYDSDSKELEIKAKTSEHGGAGCVAVTEIMEYKPNLVYVMGMGSGAIQRFAQEGVDVKSGPFLTVQEVVNNLDKLEKLEGSCGR